MTIKRRHYDKDRKVDFIVRQTWVDPVTNEVVASKNSVGAIPNHQVIMLKTK